MNKLETIFKNQKAFIAFITAGDPTIEKTIDYVLKIAEAGADLIEIGIPFSDPTAEGVVIQEANIRALKNGATTDKVFDAVAKIRQKSDVALAFMTYANVLFHYGYERFCKRCQELNVEGLMIPDLPFEEREELSGIASEYGIEVVSFIAPTSTERIKMIAKEARGFIYLISSLGVTGVRSEIKTNLDEIIAEIRKVTDVPVAIGFGISTPEQAKEMAKKADGVIVGSAIVCLVETYRDAADEAIFTYVKSMKEAL